MQYNLTEKLKWNDDPVLIIRDTELTINSDAETVLQLMDIMANRGEMQGAMEALNLLLGEKQMKKLKALRLKIDDYMTVVRTAVQLAMGNDPGEEEPAGE